MAAHVIELDFGRVPLCGRNEELQSLNDVLENQPLDKPSVVWVQAPSGSGKSSLINTFRRQQKQQRGVTKKRKRGALFLFGKHEELVESNPLEALSQALNDLMDQLGRKIGTDDGGEHYAQLFQQQLRLQEVQLLAQCLCPRILEFIELNEDFQCAADAESMWNFKQLSLAVRSLFRALRRDHQIILIQDDCQWAQNEYWEVLEATILDIRVVASSKSHPIIFVGARRPEPLSCRKELVNPNSCATLELRNLTIKDACDMVAALTGRQTDECRNLGELLHRRTAGNPMCMVLFLRHIKDRNFLYFSTLNLCWEWELDQIVSNTAMVVPESLMDLICDQIGQLEQNVQLALAVAATLGPSHFDIVLLRNVLQSPHLNLLVDQQPESLEQLLEPAVANGLLETVPCTNEYRFPHDRIRESAKIFQTRHSIGFGPVMIGKALLELAKEQEIDPRLILLAADHLNEAPPPTNADELLNLVDTNLRCSELAFEDLSLNQARTYLINARKLLEILGGWEGQYDQMVLVSTSLAKILFCSGELRSTVAEADILVAKSKSFLDVFPAYKFKISALFQLGNYNEAFDLNADVLRGLGFPFPRRETARNTVVVKTALELNWKASSITWEQLSNLPVAKDPLVIGAMEFLWLRAEMAMTSGRKSQELFAEVSMIQMTLKHGRTPHAAIAIILYAVFMTKLGRYSVGDTLSQFALRLPDIGCSNSSDQFDRAFVLVAKSFFCQHWRHSLSSSLEMVLEAKKLILNSGYVHRMFLVTMSYAITFLECGLALGSLQRDILNMHELLVELQQNHSAEILGLTGQYVLNLAGESEDPKILSGVLVENQDEAMAGYKRSGNIRAFRNSLKYQLFLAYLFNDLDLALSISRQCSSRSFIGKEGPTPLMPSLYFFKSLIGFGCARRTQSIRRALLVREGDENLGQLKKMARKGNPNVYHLIVIIEAEKLSLNHRANPGEVQQAFDKAIATSGRLGLTHCQALANELAGAHFNRTGDYIWAKTYLTRALMLFTAWGARGKSEQLKSRYADLLNDVPTTMELYGTVIHSVERFNDVTVSGVAFRQSYWPHSPTHRVT